MKANRSIRAVRSMQKLALFGGVVYATFALVVACGGGDPAGRPPLVDPGEPDGGDAQVTLPEAGELPDSTAPRPDAKAPYAFEDEEVVCNDAGPCVKELVAGREHFCARIADGTVRCWGSDELGNLGRGSNNKDADAGTTALPVVGLADVTQLSAAAHTTCARLADGSLRCWGGNQNGELGLSTKPASWDSDRHPEPVAPADVEDAVRVDVGESAVCAVLASGKLTCWGKNATGQLARPIVDIYSPEGPGEAQIDPIAVRAVQGGANSTIGLTESDELWVWGALSGQEGVNSGVIAALSPSLSPRRIEPLSKVTSFAISPHYMPLPPRPRPGEPPPPPPKAQAHACAIMSGDVYCWGQSEKAALCTGLPDPEKVPRLAPVSSTAWPQRLAVGHEITCVRMTDGTVQCCGGNEKGRLGVPTTTTHWAWFTPVPAVKGHAVQVVTSYSSACVLLQGGTVQCWGSNFRGELGTNEPDEDDHSEPHAIAF